MSHYTKALIALNISVWLGAFAAMAGVAHAGFLISFIVANLAIVFVNVVLTMTNLTKL